MNNPYRARPGRPRADNATVSNYGVQNQNSWGSMSSSTQQGIPSAAGFPGQHQMANQPKQPGDPWDWGTENVDNGNDSWNWSVDQQSEPQQQIPQQQQQQQQQQQFVPSYPNNMQTPSNPQQEGYYKNLNGNNRPPPPNQIHQVDPTTTRIPSRESTPQQTESYTNFANYSPNQQHPIPPRSSTTKMPSATITADHSQWAPPQQQQQQQNQLVDHTERQTPSFNPYFQANPPTFDSKTPSASIQSQQPPPNNYNWNGPDQQNRPVQSQNWQNHKDVSGASYWHDNSITETEAHYKNPENSWQSQNRNTTNSQAFPVNVATNQWQQQAVNRENEPPNQRQQQQQPQQQQQQPSTTTPVGPNTWNQTKSLGQSWQKMSHQTESSSGQWSKQQSVDSTGTIPEGTSEDDMISGRISTKEWSQIKPPLGHFASSTASTTSGSIPNLSSSADQTDDRKKSLATSVASSMSLNDSPIEGKASYQSPGMNERGNWIVASETNSFSDNSENVQSRENHDIDWNTDGEWSTNPRPIADLTTSVGQLSLGGDNLQLNETQPAYSSSQQILPEDIAAQPISPRNPLDNVQIDNHPDTLPIDLPLHGNYPLSTTSVTESLPQTNYDQWYNQNSPQSRQIETSTSWCPNDRARSAQQWNPELNVENYENIQQSTDFVNLEVVTPVIHERDNIYGSRDSINRETLENEPKPIAGSSRESVTSVRDGRQEIANVEMPQQTQQQSVQQTQQQSLQQTLQQSVQQAQQQSLQQAQQQGLQQSLQQSVQQTQQHSVQQTQQHSVQQTLQQTEQTPDNYEFASNDRNTFLETGELTDSHQEHESTPPSQDDENDEVPGDIPFLREVPGQSSSGDPRRNDPTGQEHRTNTPRGRNDPTGQAQSQTTRNLSERGERRDVPPGQERNSTSLSTRGDNETLERRNDPSGRERSLPPTQSRNDPSGEERAAPIAPQTIVVHEPSELREIPGSGRNSEESLTTIDNGLRQIPGGASPNIVAPSTDERSNERVVTGSQEVGSTVSTILQDQPNESRNKREEAVGASVGETPSVVGPPNRRDSYEDGDDEGSGNSRDESRERRRDGSPTDRRRYDYDRKGPYYDREYDDDYYYDRRRGPDYDRAYNSREDLDRRDTLYREGDRRINSRDDLDRHARDEPERRGRTKEDLDERDGRRRIDADRRRDRVEEPRRRDREGREFDPRYPRDREYPDRERRRDERRPRRYDDYETRDPPSRREYYEDPYVRSSRPSSRSSYNDRERDYYMRSRDPYYGYNAGYNGYDYGANYNANYYTYLENLRRTNPAAYSEWYHKYYANQHQQQAARGVPANYQEDRASVHSGRSSCEDRLFANPSFCFHAPNKSLYVSYFGYPRCVESPMRRRRSNCRNFDRTTTSEKRTLGDLSVLEDSRIVSSRMTPTKFSTCHVIGSLSIGSLLHVHACYPADGERAKVDILRMDYHLMHDPVARELRAYPGPLIKQVGVTHKKTIIEYCESKIKKAAINDELVDRASYILLYELMIMLIQQNGNVVGVDIAQLLLRNKEAHPYNVTKTIHEPVRRESTISQRSGGTGGDGSIHEVPTTSQETMEIPKQRKTVEQMTDEFRNTLLYGLVQEALEYAMTEGLWGHALFLASKLDKRTHASVMTRFANSLPVQDPLQTLYQLHSGRVPASVTCVSDPKWDDWRPHLAMIISNTSANPEMNRRAITNLGDTLGSRGDIHAAHFCYILAQIDFGAYGTPGVKLVLIGSNHQRTYDEFVTPEAIMLTEIYEYARHLSEPGFTLVDLQTFKFESARKMVDYGLMEKSLLYLEQIAVNIANDPSKYKASFINEVYTLGDRIKYHDPVCKDSIDEANSLGWLNNLAEIVGRCQTGEIVQDFTCANPQIPDTQNFPSEHENHEIQETRTIGRREPISYNEGPTSLMEVPSVDEPSEWQPLSLPANVQDQYSMADQSSHYPPGNVDNSHYHQNPQQDYWNQQNYGQQDYQSQDYTTGDWQQQQTNQSHYQGEQTDVDSSQQPTWNYESEKEEKPATPEPAPAISMGPSSGKQYDPLKELEALESPRDASKSISDSKKSSDKGAEKKNGNAGGSWFGGLFSKLTPKPKNQMILPDDNDPTIVWDPVAKKWANKDENGSDNGGTTSLAPPPKAADMGFGPRQTESPEVQQHQQPPQLNASLDQTASINSTKLVSGSNMFKLPKGRNMRANYVDVMNPGGTKSTVNNASIPTPATSPLVPVAASSPQLFVPPPITDPTAPVDFLTPTATGTPAAPGDNANQGGPMMYNPTDVKDRSMKNATRSRYPPR